MAARGADCQASPLRRGDELDRYVVLDPVGEGGAGAVYRAFDPDLERSVAIKVLRTADASSRRDALLQEARALARVSHPGIVTVHDVGLWQGQVFIAMELLEGRTVADWIEQTRPAWPGLRRAFEEAAAALEAIHAAGLVHRDVKPSNMVMTATGRVKLVDFGLAQGPSTADPRDAIGGVSGTPHYLAPELRRGTPPSPTSDLYALCRSFDDAAATAGVGAPRWFRALMRTGLDDDPARRPDSVRALLDAVRARSRRRRIGAAILVTGGIAAAVLVPRALRPAPQSIAAQEASRRGETLRDDSGWDDARATWDRETPERTERVQTRMNAFEQAWAGALGRLLDREATAHDDAATRSARVERRCLEHVWAGYAHTVRFGLSEPRHHARLAEALAAMPDPAMCNDTTDLEVDLPVPADPTQAEAVERARVDVDAVIAQLDFVGAEALLPELEALAPRIEALGFDPLTAELHAQHAVVLQHTGHLEAAAAAAERALLIGARSNHALVVARVPEVLVLTLAELGRLEAADAWARRGLADTQNREGLRAERIAILRAAAVVARRRHDVDQAAAWLDEAVASLPDDDLALEAEVRSELASLYAERGDDAPALDEADRVVELFTVRDGPLSQPTIASLVNEGRIALRLGRDAFAAGVLEEALDRYAEAPDPYYEDTARMLLGSARRRIGDTLGARDVLNAAWDHLADADEGLATELQRAKVAMELALLAAVDDTAEVRDGWLDTAVTAGEATGSDRFAASMAAGAIERLLEAGDCAAAEALATRHPVAETADEPRWPIALARVDVCRGDTAAALARLHEVLLLLDPDDPTQRRTIGMARWALHEAAIAHGDTEGARDNLRVAFATLDADALDETQWAAWVVAAARLGVDGGPTE